MVNSRKAKTGEEIRLESSTFDSWGYKFKLLLYPNGYAEGNNTHLSIFLLE